MHSLVKFVSSLSSAHSAIYFKSCGSDVSSKFWNEHQAASGYHFASSQTQAQSSIPVQIQLRDASSTTTSKLSRISLSKSSARQLDVSTFHPVPRFPTPSFRLVPMASGRTFPGSSSSHAPVSSRRPRTPNLQHELSRRERVHNGSVTGNVAHRHLSIGGPNFIPVPLRQGLIPPSGPLPILPGSASRLWPIGLRPFLETLFEDGDGKGSKISATSATTKLIEISDLSSFKV